MGSKSDTCVSRRYTRGIFYHTKCINIELRISSGHFYWTSMKISKNEMQKFPDDNKAATHSIPRNKLHFFNIYDVVRMKRKWLSVGEESEFFSTAGWAESLVSTGERPAFINIHRTMKAPVCVCVGFYWIQKRVREKVHSVNVNGTKNTKRSLNRLSQ